MTSQTSEPLRFDEDTPARLIRQGGNRLLRAVVESFLSRTPQRLSDARLALALKDRETCDRAIHQLKSSCAIMGATQMVELCTRWRARSEDGPGSDLDGILRELESEFAILRPRIERIPESCRT